MTNNGAIIEYRRKREEDPSSIVAGFKKRRIDPKDVETDSVGATELASAFALASLASLSPERTREITSPETREGDCGDDESSDGEMRSPKEDPVPITPETRSPSMSKKVTFAPNVEDHERLGPRRYSFPPRIKRDHVSRLPPSFGRFQTPSLVWSRPHPPPSTHRDFMPPPSMAPPSSPNQWICDFCNVASFATYQEACVHEESCRVHCNIALRRPPMWHPLSGHTPASPTPERTESRESRSEEAPSPKLPSSTSRKWFNGTVSLSLPESDLEWLSELNCFIRSTCVEAFSATEDHVNRTTKRGRISLHQVGIRCCFCKHTNVDEMAIAAMSFPTTVSGIYESIKRWQRVHLDACKHVPTQVRDKIERLVSANIWIPTTRQYWADSAKALGMVDTDDGIRFGRDPQLRLTSQRDENGLMGRSLGSTPSDSGADGKSIVFPEDMRLVPAYVYFLISQVESCRFTEADRFVARSKGPVGYPGFQCRHCNGHGGLGKYFPVSSKSLSTNSTSQNIHAHLLKCRKCPPELKHQLIELKEEKSRAPRLEPGWRKVFFDKGKSSHDYQTQLRINSKHFFSH